MSIHIYWYIFFINMNLNSISIAILLIYNSIVNLGIILVLGYKICGW